VHPNPQRLGDQISNRTALESSSTSSNTPLGAVMQIDAGLLNPGYVDARPTG
jgi:hypothetical protein